MAAFGTNDMLHAQFPTPAIRKALQICIKDKAIADIEDPKISVLVVTIPRRKQKPSTSLQVAPKYAPQISNTQVRGTSVVDVD